MFLIACWYLFWFQLILILACRQSASKNQQYTKYLFYSESNWCIQESRSMSIVHYTTVSFLILSLTHGNLTFCTYHLSEIAINKITQEFHKAKSNRCFCPYQLFPFNHPVSILVSLVSSSYTIQPLNVDVPWGFNVNSFFLNPDNFP